MNQNAAFFDVDGTLLALPSLEQRLFREVRYLGAIPSTNFLFWLWEAARLLPQGTEAIRHSDKMHLRGVAVRGEGSTLRHFVLRQGTTFWREALERVAWHVVRGYAIVLVTGTPQPLAKQTAELLEQQLRARGPATNIHVCATRLEEKNGRWTGRPAGDAMYGRTKATTLRTLADQHRWNLAKCYAYGDSVSDRWMLQAVGHPVAVNPSPALKALAVTRRWPMVSWRTSERTGVRDQLLVGRSPAATIANSSTERAQ